MQLSKNENMQLKYIFFCSQEGLVWAYWMLRGQTNTFGYAPTSHKTQNMQFVQDGLVNPDYA